MVSVMVIPQTILGTLGTKWEYTLDEMPVVCHSYLWPGAKGAKLTMLPGHTLSRQLQ